MQQDEFRMVSGLNVRVTPLDGERIPIIVSDGKVGVLVVLKSASRSVLASAKLKLRAGEDMLPAEVHVFVRDPIERLRSAYQFFNHRPPIEGSRATTFTWEEFIDNVLNGSKNIHWRPVSELVARAGIDPVLHLFENIGKEYPLGPLQHKNTSATIDVDMSYRKSELQSLYADDYAMRAKAGT